MKQLHSIIFVLIQCTLKVVMVYAHRSTARPRTVPRELQWMSTNDLDKEWVKTPFLKSAVTMFSVLVSVSVIVPLMETFFRCTNPVIYA